MLNFSTWIIIHDIQHLVLTFHCLTGGIYYAPQTMICSWWWFGMTDWTWLHCSISKANLGEHFRAIFQWVISAVLTSMSKLAQLNLLLCKDLLQMFEGPWSNVCIFSAKLPPKKALLHPNKQKRIWYQYARKCLGMICSNQHYPTLLECPCSHPTALYAASLNSTCSSIFESLKSSHSPVRHLKV